MIILPKTHNPIGLSHRTVTRQLPAAKQLLKHLAGPQNCQAHLTEMHGEITQVKTDSKMICDVPDGTLEQMKGPEGGSKWGGPASPFLCKAMLSQLGLRPLPSSSLFVHS